MRGGWMEPSGGDVPPGEPMPAGPPSEPQQPIPELSVSTPTLLRLRLGHPADQVPIGTDDYVLDSTYNPQIDVWEVLVLVQPGGPEDE